MPGPGLPDFYEALQISPRADQDTIARVFRHLAKRFHPDNPDSGDPGRFNEVMEAFRVLSDPEQRARYDAGYREVQEARWRIFTQETALNDIAADRRVRAGILSVLYTARRNDPDRPGVGDVELERILDCPGEHMRFHLWYLKENGWIQRLDTGHLAITAAGVDMVLDQGGPSASGVQLLEARVREHPAPTP
ncbi:MAG TPA: DnaJ domain-containing protein [Longimicrobiaceae bacterium]|nr:DnaJ domain-containing protein [Longimicrobiaceae bacterium]